MLVQPGVERLLGPRGGGRHHGWRRRTAGLCVDGREPRAVDCRHGRRRGKRERCGHLAIGANTGAARSGSVLVAGFVFTVTQAAPAPGCTYDLSDTDRSMAAGGGSFTVDVAAGSACAWTASSQASWITVSNGATGSGNGTVTLTIAANAGSQRTGTATIAGRTLHREPGGAAIDAVVHLRREPERSVGAVARRSGNRERDGRKRMRLDRREPGVMDLDREWRIGQRQRSGEPAMALNLGAERAGSVVIAGHTHTVTQASGLLPCSYSLDSTEATSGTSGGTIRSRSPPA